MSFIYKTNQKQKTTNDQEHCKTKVTKLQYDSFFISLDHVLTFWEVIILSILVFQNLGFVSCCTMVEITWRRSELYCFHANSFKEKAASKLSVIILLQWDKKLPEEVKYKPEHRRKHKKVQKISSEWKLKNQMSSFCYYCLFWSCNCCTLFCSSCTDRSDPR